MARYKRVRPVGWAWMPPHPPEEQPMCSQADHLSAAQLQEVHNELDKLACPAQVLVPGSFLFIDPDNDGERALPALQDRFQLPAPGCIVLP